MKVLFVDVEIDGHHLPYLNALCKVVEDPIILLPQNIQIVKGKLYIFSEHETLCNFFDYLRWIKKIHLVASRECVDIIHILTGDNLVKFFGLHLKCLNSRKILITFHHFRYSILRNFSRRRIFQKICFGVVHTKTLQTNANLSGINNIFQIEYPQFEKIKKIDISISRSYFNIPCDKVPVLAAIGGTRIDKGLDILLAALVKINRPFYLLIAGKEEDYKIPFIQKMIYPYRKNVFLALRFLNENELNLAFNAADIVILPYRQSFDGASGPLVYAVQLKKCVIGPNHGSLGELIKENHLGNIFITGDIDDLAATIEKQIDEPYQQDKVASEYVNKLNVKLFQSNYWDIYNKMCV